MPKLRSPAEGLFFFPVPRSSDENEFRKDFTPSERVAIGEAIEAEIKTDAEKRMKSGVENPVENFPQGGEKTRDLVAKATGFGNGKTLGAAM